MSVELSEQEIVRRNSLAELKKLGINPYPDDDIPLSRRNPIVIVMKPGSCRDGTIQSACRKYNI